MNDETLSPHSSAAAILADLRARFPDTPFLALGQTALWDEPTKASLRLALDALWPDARIIAAAHDTDYFAKLPGHPSSAGEAKYAMVLHDDATTRGLWSAAGEMSRLFGSEDVVTRAMLEERAGVELHRALAFSPDPKFELSELTAAWGWTGIIHTEWDRKIVRDVPVADILPALLEQLEWATGGTADCLEGERAESARRTAETIRNWVQTFARTRPEASLSDLYRDLLPRFYELLLGGPPANLSTSSTTRLLRFNRETCILPRFAFVNAFLSPITRKIAVDSYNLAVGGSGAYTLEGFGEGALPFDLVIPGRGRGTLCVPGDGTIIVNTPRQPIVLCDRNCDFADVRALAGLVERELGPDCALVGKAVTLLPMLAAEFVMVFHEGASGYTPRTRQMMARLVARNIPLPELRPILRLKYATWDALEAVPPVNGATDTLRLPEHLAQSFCRETISFEEFSTCWQYARERETKRLRELEELHSPREILDYLARTQGDGWQAKQREYEAASVRLLALRDQALAIQGRIYTLYDQVRRLKSEVVRIERAKGDDFRARIQPLRERLSNVGPGEATQIEARIAAMQSERATTFDAEIAERLQQVRFAMMTVRDLKIQRRQLEWGTEAVEARTTLRRIESEAERAKARLARNAIQAVYGLEHTDYRPSAWWFPLVDPSGAWFQRLAETAEYYEEPLTVAE
jgi:hypothetical protein